MKTVDRPAPATEGAPEDKAPDNQAPKQPVVAQKPTKKADPKRKRLALLVGIPVVLLAGLIGYNKYKWGQWHVSTDDAYTTSDVFKSRLRSTGASLACWCRITKQ